MADSSFQLVPIKVNLEIDLTKVSLNMQGLYDMIVMSYPKDPEIKIIGISLPIIGLDCKVFGLFYPDFDIKESITRIYDYMMKVFIRPIWTVLSKLYEALKKFGLEILDFKLPILNLSISDLFSDNLYDKLVKVVTDLYENSKEKLLSILKKLNIPYPLFDNLFNPKMDIGTIVKNILSSLWDELLKILGKMLKLIRIGLLAFDLATYKIPTLSQLWDKAVQAILGKILSFFAAPFSLEDIKNMVIKFAQKLYNKVVLTWDELYEALKKFKLPIFGSPFDWKFPIEISISAPNVDFVKLLTDIKVWITNFIWNLLLKFVQAILKILSVFNLDFLIPKIKIPIVLCGVKEVVPNTA